ncbi:uncharacterized protein TRAVEDRAFT_26422, partial [Trametes versicolor FP-101664 SS1]|uniref:uncharacterized protein n=1 Tax=Trametes versicolor (strain FP-101664) TaxID=717944 RepID=UPI0004621777
MQRAPVRTSEGQQASSLPPTTRAPKDARGRIATRVAINPYPGTARSPAEAGHL